VLSKECQASESTVVSFNVPIPSVKDYIWNILDDDRAEGIAIEDTLSRDQVAISS
jgi:hypothetical protein